MAAVAKGHLHHSGSIGTVLLARCDLGAIFAALRSGTARPLRFVLTGGLAALVQLVLLHVGTGLGWDTLLANTGAFLLAAQVNFWISDRFTWADRQPAAGAGKTLARRWARFHLSIIGTGMLNMAVFAVARAALGPLVSAALGIGAAGLTNFVLGDRFVFRAAGGPPRRG